MKPLRLIISLGAAAVILTAAFVIVDKRTKVEKDRKEAGAAKQLFQIDTDSVSRITIDNEEGHFAFQWNTEACAWELTSEDQFNLNTYAVSAICNFFCTLASEKTVAFDCEDPSAYGFANPVTVKLYTQDTDDEHPYILYVGDNTPTYDAYYAMVDGSDDVFTIDYTRGSVFCVAKQTLKNMYIFDTYGTLVTRYRAEVDGALPVELKKDNNSTWQMIAPAQFEVKKSAADNLSETLVRTTVSAYVEDDPESLAPYGLDKPWAKLWLDGIAGDAQLTPMSEEIWFGSNVSDKENETELYGYFARTKQVFRILRADISFLRASILEYTSPYCLGTQIQEMSSIEVDMGDVYALHETLYVDYDNDQYALGSIDITALEDDSILGRFQDFYRAVSMLEISDIDLDAKPDGDPAITMTYTYRDGRIVVLTFIPQSDNSFYLMQDGVYTGKTVRLNRFTGDNKMTKCYELLKQALK